MSGKAAAKNKTTNPTPTTTTPTINTPTPILNTPSSITPLVPSAVNLPNTSQAPMPASAPITEQNSRLVELNVGGVLYTTTRDTLLNAKGSRLDRMFSESSTDPVLYDSKGKVFIDRDGVLFRYVLDYLRNLKLVLPENFHERERLKQEAYYFQLPELLNSLSVAPRPIHLPPISPIPSIGVSSTVLPVSVPISERTPGYITMGYRGTFAFGRDGMADVKFRKLSRIIVCGKVSLCREVFRDTLNESRDPDRGETDRYTGRFFLKHTFLEQAFDMLQESGFVLTGCCGSGTNSAGEVKAGLDTEEAKWQHYSEFIFERR